MAPLLASRINCLEPPRAVATACSRREARLCTMPIQLPATCTTARLASSRTSWACCDSNIRVEGSSRLPRICCHSSGRLALGDGPGVETVGSSGAAAGAFGLGAGASVGLGVAGATGAGVGAGFASALGTDAAAAEVAVDGTNAGSASNPSSSTSSQRRGCTLWRSCCSEPRSWACHCSSRFLPIALARGGS